MATLLLADAAGATIGSGTLLELEVCGDDEDAEIAAGDVTS